MASKSSTTGAKPLSQKDIWGEGEDAALEQQMAQWDAGQLRTRTQILEGNMAVMRRELSNMEYEKKSLQAQVNENNEKIKMHKQLPYLVSNVVEILEVDMESEDPSDSKSEVSLAALKKDKEAAKEKDKKEGGAAAKEKEKEKEKKEAEEKRKNALIPTASKGKKLDTCLVIKTSTRQTVFLPMPGLVDPKELKPNDLVGVNKDNYLVLEKLPAEYDSRVKAFEVDERPTEDYSDIGGLDQQILELVEAIVRPMTHKHLFEKLGITPPKGVLMYGPPGTGKTMLARACAARTKACFLKLAATELVQMFIGDGAKMIRDVFALAKEKKPAIIFIDELDAIGTKRFDSGKSGDREVQRTMLELLNQLDGFSSTTDIKIIAATNRPDILDPALLRSGRLDRKIEFPLPDENGRMKILQIHSSKMSIAQNDVNFLELARCTEDFNGADLKAMCTEAAFICLRREGSKLLHEDFVAAIDEVKAKKKSDLNYYA